MHIEGRRWFERTNGNTYHSVRIYQGSAELVYIPFTYGYGDCFLQTAIDWLKDNGHIASDAPYGTRYLRETLGASYSVIDVSRKGDL